METPRKPTKRVLATIVRVYSDPHRWTRAEIAEWAGWSTRTVGRRLRSLGVEVRRTGPRGRRDVADATLLDLREQGLSYQVIADQVRMSKTGVRNRLLAAQGLRRPDRRG